MSRPGFWFLKCRFIPNKPRFIGLTHFDGALENMKKALSEERSEMSSAEEPEIFEESVISDDKKALWSSLWPFYVT